MTLTRDLPIYGTTYKLTSLLFDYVPLFPKLYRFTIGLKLLDTSIALFRQLIMANNAGNDRQLRVSRLQLFLVELEQLRVLIRLCNEKHILNRKQIAKLARLTAYIGRQANIWKNS